MGPIVNLLKIAIAHLSRVSCIQLCRLLQNRSGKTRQTYKHFNKNTLLDYFPFNTWEVRLSLSHRWRRYRINPLQVSLWMQTKPPTKCQKIISHIFLSSSFSFFWTYTWVFAARLHSSDLRFRFLRGIFQGCELVWKAGISLGTALSAWPAHYWKTF